MRRFWLRWWLAAWTLGLAAAAGAASPGEAERLRLTVLFDNVGGHGGLAPGWGFACLVEARGNTLLFDTGADGAVLLANMQRLGHRADALDAVVLSHIHADHTGGLAAVLAARPGLDLWLPDTFPAAFVRDIARRGARLHPVRAGGPLFGPFASTGPLDHGLPEQALIIDTARGLVVVTGCAHPGVVSIAETAIRLTGRPIHLLIGGFHLLHADAAQVDDVAARLQALGVERVAPSHCTGAAAIARFRRAWGARFVEGGLGAVLEVPLK
jgi:7,8-dihydropterin-6-yl-methyl-4-(beta-D-ribofuranosyl)aminobenzene 5'-phosphate synthase